MQHSFIVTYAGHVTGIIVSLLCYVRRLSFSVSDN